MCNGTGRSQRCEGGIVGKFWGDSTPNHARVFPEKN